jgi:hypothetical protein
MAFGSNDSSFEFKKELGAMIKKKEEEEEEEASFSLRKDVGSSNRTRSQHRD